MTLAEVEEKIQKTLSSFRDELSRIRSGRATPSLIENIPIQAYNTRMSLKQLAAISAPDARLLTVEVWDQTQIEAVVKGIQEANIGLNPQVEGQHIRLPLPPLSFERREQLVKLIRKKTEEFRVQIRQIRKEAKKAFGNLPEDEKRRQEGLLQDRVDSTMQELHARAAKKEEDLLTIG